MNPTCETEEYARVLFKSMENKAKKAPINIFAKPNRSTPTPHTESYKNRFELMTTAPKIPVFVKTPDNRADAGAGALG